MGLDDREQKILEEIERQFYQEDPHLAAAVRTISRVPMTAGRIRMALVGAAIGLAFLLWTFQRSTLLAGVGFVVMVGFLFVAVQGKRSTAAPVERLDDQSIDD